MTAKILPTETPASWEQTDSAVFTTNLGRHFDLRAGEEQTETSAVISGMLAPGQTFYPEKTCG